MGRMGRFDCKGLKDFQQQLGKLQNPDDFVESCAKELAARLLRMVVKRTPVGQYPASSGKKGGTLRRGWTGEKRASAQGYQYIIYPWYYGIETLDLYGEPVTWVCPELERRISEALAVDERITGVTDFEFDLTVKGVVHAYFTVNTIYGDIKAEKGVKI